MLYECPHFKVVSCIAFADPRWAVAKLGAQREHVVNLELAGAPVIKAKGTSRLDALFAAFGKALGETAEKQARQTHQPAPSDRYEAEWRGVAEAFHQAKSSLLDKVTAPQAAMSLPTAAAAAPCAG